MKYIIISLFAMLAALMSIAQLPKGLPSPFSNGYSQIGYSKIDSGLIQTPRDTSWRPRFVGTSIILPSTNVEYVWDGTKWIKANGNGVANVKDFGAKGDGITDDSQAFKNAFRKSKSIYIPQGIFSILNVHIPENAVIKGENENSIIKCTNGIAFISDTLVIDRVYISNIKFELHNATGIKVSRLLGTELKSRQLLPGPSCELNVTGCTFYAPTTGCKGIVATELWNARIDKNTFEGIPGYISDFVAMDFSTSDVTFNIAIHVTNNLFFNVQDCVYINGGVDDYFNYNTGYFIFNNLTSGVVRYGIYTKNVDYLQAEQNMFDFTTIPVYSLNTFNLKLRHNYFASRGEHHCVEVVINTTNPNIANPNYEYTEIINNRMFSYAITQGSLNPFLTGGTGGDGIKVTTIGKSMNQFQISGNTLDGLINAIDLNTYGSTGVTGGIIQNNIIRACTNGIMLGLNTASNVISNNSIVDVITTPIGGAGIVNNIVGQNTINGVPTSHIFEKNGNVGIDVFSPTYKFQVGGGNLFGLTQGGRMITESPDSTVKSALYSTNDAVYFGAVTNNRLYLRTHDIDRFTIDENGLVRIFNLQGTGDRLIKADVNGALSTLNLIAASNDTTTVASTANATDATTTQALVNELKAKINSLIIEVDDLKSKMRASGILKP